jgi:hypothetical protein
MQFITETEATDLYDEMLDECYPDQIGNLLASRILRECDPTAYWCGFSDWLDGMGLTTDETEADEEEV